MPREANPENKTPSPSDIQTTRKPRKRWNELHQIARVKNEELLKKRQEQVDRLIEEEGKQCTFKPHLNMSKDCFNTSKGEIAMPTLHYQMKALERHV